MKRILYGTLLATSVCSVAPQARAGAECSRQTREADPIVFSAHPSAFATVIANFSAFRFDGKQFIPVPLQVDEKNKDGDYVLEGGMPFTAHSDDGRMDDNDEMVVRGADLGQAFRRTDVDAFLGEMGADVWQLRFCRGDAWLGNLLLMAATSRPAPAFAPAVQFSVKGKTLVTDQYRYDFRADNPILLGDVFLKRDGKERRLFADSWFHMTFKLPWWLPDFHLINENFTSEIESWRVGPVRAIVAVGVKLKKFLSIFNFHMFSELVFYPGRLEIPTVLEFPASPHSFFQPGSGLAYYVAFPPGETWGIDADLLNVEDPEFVSTLTPRPAQGRPYLVRLRGPWGQLSLNVRVGSDNGKSLPEPLMVQKTISGSKVNLKYFNWLKEKPGDLGVFTDISQIEKGKYHFGLDLRLNNEADQRAYVVFDRPSVQWETLSPH